MGALVYSLICVCVLSLACSSVWSMEIEKLSTKKKCPEANSVLLCPLHQNIADPEHQANIKQYLSAGTLKLRHLVNTYYTTEVVNTEQHYCKENLQQCREGGNNKLTALKDDILYVSSFDDEKSSGTKKVYYMYMAFDIIVQMTQVAGTIKSLDEFKTRIREIDAAADVRDMCSNVHERAFKEYNLSCAFFTSPYEAVISTFKRAILKDLSPSIIAEYKRELRAKLDKKEMTTFEWFMYWSIVAKEEEKTFQFLFL